MTVARVLVIATAALALCLAGARGAETIRPRQVVEHIAKLIEDNYVHADEAHKIAADLRSDAGKDAFDKLTDPINLATALTERLSKIDLHFYVSWSPPDAQPKAAEPHGPDDAAYARLDAFANYGFRNVSVLPGNIGYVELEEFADFNGDDANAPAKRAADAAMQLIAHTDAVIFDVRGNGGGSPAMVGYLISYFVPKNADIYNTFRGRDGGKSVTLNERPLAPIPMNPRLEVPLYVLTSGRTGSAAESFPYTLQAAKRARIIGERSAGAANPGDALPAGDGFEVFISLGEPINPITHSNWERTGVVPDRAVAASGALKEAKIEALTQSLKTLKFPEEKTDASWALEALELTGKEKARSPLGDYTGGYGSRRIELAGGKLTIYRDGRPPTILIPIGGDVFTTEDMPSLRVRFERDPNGKIAAMVQETSFGDVQRFPRALQMPGRRKDAMK